MHARQYWHDSVQMLMWSVAARLNPIDGSLGYNQSSKKREKHCLEASEQPWVYSECNVCKTVVLAFETTRHKCKERFDKSTPRSFMNLFIVGRLGLRARHLLKTPRLFVATGELLYINSMGI